MELIMIQPEDKCLENFTIYFVKNYVGPQALFHPRVWASATEDLWRMTNACESFHSKFNAACDCPHPSIDKFLKCLQYAQTSSIITRNSIRLDHTEAKRKEVVKKQNLSARNCSNIKTAAFHQNYLLLNVFRFTPVINLILKIIFVYSFTLNFLILLFPTFCNRLILSPVYSFFPTFCNKGILSLTIFCF